MLLPVALRDTALTAAALAGLATATSFEEFRQKCKQQVERLRVEMTSAGHPADVIDDAAYAQCALLDEVALSSLNGQHRDAWERDPLQLSEFESHDAGKQLVTRIEQRLAQHQPVWPLLAIFQTVLNLGFKGKFVQDGVDARMALMRAIDERLGRSGEPDEMSSPVVVRPAVAHRWSGLSSALACVVIACMAAGVAYVALDRWLTASIARLVH
jgi:type VI secretion system protein ImpK